MKDKNIFYNEKTIVAIILFLFLIFFYGILYYLNLELIQSYQDVILPGFKVEGYDISELSFKHAKTKIELLSKDALKKNVTLKFVEKEMTSNLGDLGLTVDIDKTIQAVYDYQNHLSFSRKLWYANDHDEDIVFPIHYVLDDNKIRVCLSNLNDSSILHPVDGYFDTSDGVRYVPGVDGYQINVEESLKAIHHLFDNPPKTESYELELTGSSIPANTNDSYRDINTLASSFVTTYNTWIYARAYNLRTAVNYINGAIIEPGEVFSYYDYAGPYDKEGYVFYYKYIGNGVCQVATTVYNAALLGGHEIVARSPHDKKSEYVDGGRDATVASYPGGWNIDMQWRNVYDYPVYLKAYDVNGEIHVELWSHPDAKGGKTYTMESVWLGGRGYSTYRHTYLNDEEIDVSHIATTWYPND